MPVNFQQQRTVTEKLSMSNRQMGKAWQHVDFLILIVIL